MSALDDIRDERMKKLELLREKGIDPYPADSNRTHTVAEALDQFSQLMDKEEVSIAGRVMSVRGHGGLVFIDIYDGTGKIQGYLKADTLGDDNLALFEQVVDMGDFVELAGTLTTTKRGEQSILANDWRMLSKSLLPLPEKWHGLQDIEARFRKRYLDTLMNEEVRDRFLTRSRIITSIRKYLDDRDFVEVETPTLQPVYGGGFAKPFVTHHNALDSDFYLRISDEMYLKRLIVGGLSKVYEITKVFRNEGIDHDHNPEFTMFEAQIAYEDYKYGMDLMEEIFETVALDVVGKTEMEFGEETIDVKRPWKRHTMVESIKEYAGVDVSSWGDVEQAKKDIEKMDISEGSYESLETMQSVGELIAFVFEELVEEKLIQPTIIYDYPVEVSPLAKRKVEDPRFAERFEFFAFGSELGNNYSELNDPIDLKQRFVEEKNKEKAGFDEAHQTDTDYLEAIEHGFPPTCGVAIGIDRMVMLYTNARNIKEVIAFPTMKSKE